MLRLLIIAISFCFSAVVAHASEGDQPELTIHVKNNSDYPITVFAESTHPEKISDLCLNEFPLFIIPKGNDATYHIKNTTLKNKEKCETSGESVELHPFVDGRRQHLATIITPIQRKTTEDAQEEDALNNESCPVELTELNEGLQFKIDCKKTRDEKTNVPVFNIEISDLDV